MATHTNCESITRRDCLQFGLGGMLGGGLANLLHAQAIARDSSQRTATAKRCILIWMDGGPTHYEMFDPKPGAPQEIRGEFGAIQTTVAGVHFSEKMEQLSQLTDKCSIIRSIRHNQGNHGAGNHYMMTGAPPRIPVGCGAFVSFHPSMGSVVSYQHDQRHPQSPMPGYFSLPRMSRSGGPNFLGAKYAPFVVPDDPNSSGFTVRDVTVPSGIDDKQFQSRSGLRSRLDNLPRLNDKTSGDPAAAIQQYYEQGYDLVMSAEAQIAFDISRESDKIRDRYQRDSFGQRCLLARRLVEADVPFVTVYDGGWDHHRDIFTALKPRLPSWDQTVAALIEDLDERGMLEETLVLALGEFGRTPKVNSRGGRDHWSNAMSVLIAGGGTPGGLVVGATDRNGYSAVDNVKSPENFVSTVYAKLGINPDQMLYTPNGRPTHLVSDPTPIRELMG
ncbi:MAG: DUF1501 domain-containing protein [Pirellulaceae bacterium]|nr:DUF1501 domain-containing protein [Pirellulaceae bacterium]